MRLFTLLIVISLASRPALAQAPTPPLPPEPATLLATYRLTYQPDSTDPATRTDLLYLWLGKGLSLFESQAKFDEDSLVAVFDKLPFNQETAALITPQLMALPQSQFSYAIYKTTAPRHLYYYDRIGLQHYHYQEPAPLTWTIEPATAPVAGYACQRATTSFGGRQWEAWFTREVPVGDGPYKFYGLPGLIVKVGDTRGHYLFELTQLRPLTPPVAIAPPETGAKLITKAEYQRGKAEYERNGLAQLMASGNIRYSSPEAAAAAQQKARERAKRKTNPLELR